MTPAEKANENARLMAARRGQTARPLLTDAQLAGEEPLSPDTISPTPKININQPYDALAAAVAKCVPGKGLYWHDGFYCTIHRAENSTGFEFRPMTPDRFSTWLPANGVCRFFSPARSEKVPEKITSLSPAQCKIIMEADVLRAAVPEVREVAPIRLPLVSYNKKGEIDIYPAPLGYDPSSKIYTLDGLPMSWDRHKVPPLERCVRILAHIFSEFPLDGGDLPLTRCRSLGAVITAMLGQFLHHSIPLFPMVVANANQPGTGKTFCIQAILAPFFGFVSPGNYIEDENEMRKTLNAALFDGSPYYFLDDVRAITGRNLPRFITGTRIRDRELGTNRLFDKPQRMQFFVTGNSLKMLPDLERRQLPIDLFFAGDATKRTGFKNLKEEHFRSEEWRRSILQCLWGLCVHWLNAGAPSLGDVPALTSFKPYVGLAAAIAVHAGFASPFGERLVELDAGDTMGKALIELVIYLADLILPPADDPNRPHSHLTATYTVENMVEIAKAHHILDIITNGARDPHIALGRAMRTLNGRQFTDSLGRTFLVGGKTRRASTEYPFFILSEPVRTMEETATLDAPPEAMSAEDAEAMAEFEYSPGDL